MDMISIIPAQARYFQSHADTLNSVAREGKYLSTNTGYTLESVTKFCEYCARMGYPQYFAVNSEGEAVGWCDIVRRDGSPREVGYIGVGLRADYRGAGIGPLLMRTAMDNARLHGFRTICLDCRVTNEHAIHVYKKLGFQRYGVLGKGMMIGGEYVPLVRMRKRLA